MAAALGVAVASSKLVCVGVLVLLVLAPSAAHGSYLEKYDNVNCIGLALRVNLPAGRCYFLEKNKGFKFYHTPAIGGSTGLFYSKTNCARNPNRVTSNTPCLVNFYKSMKIQNMMAPIADAANQ